MEIKFKSSDLRELYETGSSKKHKKLEKRIIKSYIEAIEILKAAFTIYDLWHDPSLHFEKMQGFPNRFSARITGKYRLEIEVAWKNAGKTIGIFNIDKISKHYQ